MYFFALLITNYSPAQDTSVGRNYAHERLESIIISKRRKRLHLDMYIVFRYVDPKSITHNIFPCNKTIRWLPPKQFGACEIRRPEQSKTGTLPLFPFFVVFACPPSLCSTSLGLRHCWFGKREQSNATSPRLLILILVSTKPHEDEVGPEIAPNGIIFASTGGLEHPGFFCLCVMERERSCNYLELWPG